MAVNIPGSNNAPQAPAPAAQVAAPPQVQAQAPVQQQAIAQPTPAQSKMTNTVSTHVPSSSTVFGRRRHGMQTSNASGLAAEMLKLFDESMKSPPQDGNKYDVMLINAGESGLKISALVFVALPADVKAPKKLAHHTLLLAATAPKEPVKVHHNLEFARNRKVERTLMACDGNDEQMKKVVKDALARRYPGYIQLSAEASEVPRAILASDAITLNNLMGNATRAAGTILYHEGNDDSEDLALSDLVDPETKEKAVLSVEINSSFAHQANMVKFPTRADIILTVSESQGRNNNNEVQEGFNSQDSSNRISRVSGYLDLSWTGPQNMGAGMNMGMQQTNIHYSPQFIVTDVDTEVTETLPTLFLALAPLQLLADNGRWKQYLIKQHIEGAAHLVAETKNLRDLGLIGYEVPPMGGYGMDPMAAFMNGGAAVQKAPFPTATLNHDHAFLDMIVNTYIGNTVLPVSFDIPESGPSTWVTSVLLHAAIGGAGCAADNVMRSALDLLTDGEFSTQYATNPNSNGGKAALMINNNMLVNLGYWSDPSYGDRDIRDLDYLGYLAMTGGVDPEAQANWHGLHVNTNIDPWLRLEKMTEIQRSIFANMEIYGRAARVTINPVALFVLASIIAQKGFAYELKDNNSDNSGIQRMVAPWLPQISMGLGQSGAFVTTHQNRQGAGNYIGGITNSGRYGNNQGNNGGVSY